MGTLQAHFERMVLGRSLFPGVWEKSPEGLFRGALPPLPPQQGGKPPLQPPIFCLFPPFFPPSLLSFLPLCLLWQQLEGPCLGSWRGPHTLWLSASGALGGAHWGELAGGRAHGSFLPLSLPSSPSSSPSPLPSPSLPLLFQGLATQGCPPSPSNPKLPRWHGYKP